MIDFNDTVSSVSITVPGYVNISGLDIVGNGANSTQTLYKFGNSSIMQIKAELLMQLHQ